MQHSLSNRLKKLLRMQKPNFRKREKLIWARNLRRRQDTKNSLLMPKRNKRH